MKIETGKPAIAGRYACFLGTDRVATVVRWWQEGRWFVNNGEPPLKQEITAWIGPLPTRGEAPASSMEFDL